MGSTQWSRVDLGDAVVTGLGTGGYGQAYAYGAARGRPLLALLGPAGAEQRLTPLGSGPVTSASFAESYTLVVGRAYPLLVDADFPDGVHGSGDGRVEDSSTEGAVRLFTCCPSEDPLVLTVRGDGWLVVSEPGGGALATGRGLRLTDDVEDADLVVGGRFDLGLLVAGPLVGGDGSTSPLWSVDFYEGWRPEVLEATPDEVTDIEQRYFGCVAGHRDLAPVVHGPDREARPVPDVRLDPDRPVVRLLDGDEVLAVQATGGPQLWVRDGGTWAGEDLPDGRLDAAVRGRTAAGDDRLFVVLDGQVWQRPTVT
jgi:hypothetical protein